MPKRIDVIGHRYGRLVIEADAGVNRWKGRLVAVLCDCGTRKNVLLGMIRCGKTTSCGCRGREIASEVMRKNKTTHGMRNTRTYNTWVSVIARCTNKSNPGYKNYGGRGILMCDRWRESFQNFLDDMGERPEGMTLDRWPDQNGNYEPGNCRWATPQMQSRNTRQNRFIDTPDGRMLAVVAAEKYGIPIATIRMRLCMGWPDEKVLQPVRKIRKDHGNLEIETSL